MQLPKIALVISRFNSEITTLLHQGAVQRLMEKGVTEDQIQVYYVPGAIEIPITAQAIIATGKYQAVICFGLVIRGETTHYDYVCSQVSYGCQRLALDTGIPVVFGILTTENEQQAYARCGGEHGHKGQDCADAALEMIEVLRLIHEN